MLETVLYYKQYFFKIGVLIIMIQAVLSENEEIRLKELYSLDLLIKQF